MRAIVDKKQLENSLVLASKLANKSIIGKTPLPILSHFLIEAVDGKIKISATDLEVGIETSIDSEILSEGSFTVPAKTFIEIVSLISDDVVTLSKDESGNELEITFEGSSCKLLTLNSEEFPIIPKSDDLPIFSMFQKDFKEAIKSISFSAASKEETRAVLTGILLIISKSFARFVATDGKRLALSDVKINYDSDDEHRYIIPKNVLHEISNYIKPTDDILSVGVKNSQIFFNMGHSFVISRLFEGNYPEFDRVIPSSTKYNIIFERNSLLSAMKFILALSQAKNFPKLVIFELNNKKMILKSSTPDLGSAYKEIPCDFDGDSVNISFNGQYFIDVLDVLPTDKVLLSFTDDNSPGVVKPVFNEIPSENYICVIMPINVRKNS